MKRLIVDDVGLIHSSPDVPAGLGAGEWQTGSESSELRALNAAQPTAQGWPVEERRRHNELPLDIIGLLASCGERVRHTDSAALQSSAEIRNGIKSSRS